MKIIKFYTLLLSSIIFVLASSCVNNDDKGPDEPGGGGEIPLTPENLEKGEWEIAYMTQRIRATNNGGPDITFRMYGMDGFTKEFYKDSLYMERNTYGEETIYEGKYSLYPQKDSIVLEYGFLNPETELREDSVSRIRVYKLSDKALVYHISFPKAKGAKDQPEFRQLVFYLRNKKNAPDEFLESNDILLNNEKLGRIDPSSLNGSWRVDTVRVRSKSASNTTWTVTKEDLEKIEEQRSNIGLVYTYDTTKKPYKFTEAQIDGTRKTGEFTVTDDVMHYYHENDVEGKTKKVMESMAVDMDRDKKGFRYTYNIYSLTTSSFYVQQVIVSFKKVQ